MAPKTSRLSVEVMEPAKDIWNQLEIVARSLQAPLVCGMALASRLWVGGTGNRRA